MAEITNRKAALIRELDRTRGEMSAHLHGARAHADLGRKVRVSFARNALAWLGGAGLLGLVLSKIPPRAKKVVIRPKVTAPIARAGRAGFVLGALKVVLDLTKPILLAWVTKRIGDVAQTAKKTERKVERVERKV